MKSVRRLRSPIAKEERKREEINEINEIYEDVNDTAYVIRSC